MTTAVIVRGLPGAGKSTLAQAMAPYSNVATDDWFDRFNGGEWDPTQLKEAHAWCLDHFAWLLAQDEHDIVAVHNTFTRQWEYDRFLQVAKRMGAIVHVITVENVQGTMTTHGVPAKKVEEMKDRYELTLTS